MIRIKRYILNEKDIKVIENVEDLLTIIFKDGSYRETQGTFDDIEWNYEQSNIKEDEYIELSNKYQRLSNRNEELEEENKRLKEELKALKGE